MVNRKVVIVGTGLSGLACGLDLICRGFTVEFIEQNDTPGGRLNRISAKGYTFDSGPSFFSMSYVFKDFMNRCGIELPFRFKELDPLYCVRFTSEEKNFYIHKDIGKFADQFKDIEPGFEEKLTRYLDKTGKIFDNTFDTVIRKNYSGITDHLLTMLKVNPKYLNLILKNFGSEIERHFESEQARSIISLVAFFLGRTPFDTMAIYTLLSYCEFRHDGYHSVEGGMYSIVTGIVDELKKRGAIFNYNRKIVSIEYSDKLVTGVKDNLGKVYEGDIFIVNSDAANFRGKVLKRKAFSEAKLSKKEWTMGYLTFYIGLKKKLPSLTQHNYFIGEDLYGHSRSILKGLKEKDTSLFNFAVNSSYTPYYYVNVVSKSDTDAAPEGCEALFFVCPVPNMLTKTDWSDSDMVVNSILDDFAANVGEEIKESIDVKIVYTPEVWERKFSLYKGSGLGLSHRLNQIGALRPSNKDEVFSNLFYTGSSTVPGAGLPMAIISAELTCERVMDYTKRGAYT